MLTLPSPEVVVSEIGVLFQTFSERVQVVSHDNTEALKSAAHQVAGFLQAHPLQVAEVGIVSGLLLVDRLMRGQSEEVLEKRVKTVMTNLNVLDAKVSSKSQTSMYPAEFAQTMKSVQQLVEAERKRSESDKCLLNRLESMQSEFDAMKTENARLWEQLERSTGSSPATGTVTAALADTAAIVETTAAPRTVDVFTLFGDTTATTAVAASTALPSAAYEEVQMQRTPALLRGLTALASTTQHTLRSTLQVSIRASVQQTVQQLTQRVSTLLTEWRGRSLSAVLALVAAVVGRGLAARGLERLQQALLEMVEQRRGEEDSSAEEGGVQGGFRYLDSRAEVFA
jgi:cell division protein ZapA (FtsZ GTPase activity inhibitor)